MSLSQNKSRQKFQVRRYSKNTPTSGESHSPIWGENREGLLSIVPLEVNTIALMQGLVLYGWKHRKQYYILIINIMGESTPDKGPTLETKPRKPRRPSAPKFAPKSPDAQLQDFMNGSYGGGSIGAIFGPR